MENIQVLPMQSKDKTIIIDIMQILSDYFSPETIEFAEEKILTLTGFVAKDKDIIVGFITFENISKSKAKIYWMGVLPSYRHQGIGSVLMKQTEALLSEQGIKKIELLTLDEHPDYPGYLFTRNFYKKHGFEIKDSYREEDVTILTMIKKL
ncbi:hypothetical protein P148_SR1C00001G0307 [candidate division SR1 bacterium RAAC1_SR1_1]|nr:hypothetical protein P148_SR1C00001G0307 [candidate division SR1 bacterium RAAC1_SR1_1]